MSAAQSTSVLNPANLAILEELYEQFRRDPSSVDAQWRDLFRTLDAATPQRVAAAPSGNGAGSLLAHAGKLSDSQTRDITDLHMKALLLVQAYRRHGHFAADTDPLGFKEYNRDHLSLAENRLNESDLDREVDAWLGGRESRSTLRELIARMEKTYCSSIGVEFFYIRDESRREWMMERLESEQHLSTLPAQVKLMIFEKLHNAEHFERFIHTRFPGKKRFSLEGGESLIPALASIIENAGAYGIHQMVLGMAHRGRLNVLANIMGKDPAQIFAEFNEIIGDEEDVAGDVKYHLGYSSDVTSLGGQQVHLSLAFNPSHLEVINAVVLGSCRARQTRSKDQTRTNHLPVLIHGDAAFSGQGINYETLNMSGLHGYSVGGAIHIVVNNQIGFTTDPSDSRSTPYCTDLAKMLQSPIFHVNGNDPEACYRAIMLALEWRQRFRSDVFLDLICYRRWGHNETDEPAFTQPVIYNRIKALPSVVKIYEDRLLAEGVAAESIQAIKDRANQRMEDALRRVQEGGLKVELEAFGGNWSGFQKAEAVANLNPETGVARERLELIAEHVTRVPDGFEPNSKIARLLEQRRKMVAEGDARLDWGMAETLAYGSLLLDGTTIRLSGQDAKRGTFSHRHAAIFDTNHGAEYIALDTLNPEQARFEVVNSLLSEEAVLGFEFGYSLADPHTLTIWEAQFGDFVNGAQVVIDQFICSCEAKWNRQSGLVMLLPHGYEGQGPEHSSARPERFLQLCSQNNIQVCNLTTPAQFFHLLRRQMKRRFRKPLVVLSPKSLLRLPEAASSFQELCEGRFQEVIDERDSSIQPNDVERLVFCTGKLYYDLVAERKKRGQQNVAIVTIEQLYLYPVNEVAGILQRYPNARDVVWAQEEPRNQGAWTYIENRLHSQLRPEQRLIYIGRTPSPSPATGYFKVHQREQQQILEQAMRVQTAAAVRN